MSFPIVYRSIVSFSEANVKTIRIFFLGQLICLPTLHLLSLVISHCLGPLSQILATMSRQFVSFFHFIPYALANVGISLYPQAFQIVNPSEPNSHLTRLLTASEILLNSFTSISGVLSVTVISPPFRLRWLNLHQNCLVDTIFIQFLSNELH